MSFKDGELVVFTYKDGTKTFATIIDKDEVLEDTYLIRLHSNHYINLEAGETLRYPYPLELALSEEY